MPPENVNKPASDDDGPPAEFLEFQQRLKVRQTSDTPAGAVIVLNYKLLFTPQPLRAVRVLFSPMVSSWAGGRQK